ncbi:MAG: hypothetical protein RMJ36_06450 [Candidatus Calescibacterium sp.]|nr:hypothetical protein [Candidatus Calescibacterium sp.]MDW8133275.1 hypothetical protein [Candidatus Calescibacterium sp.]
MNNQPVSNVSNQQLRDSFVESGSKMSVNSSDKTDNIQSSIQPSVSTQGITDVFQSQASKEEIIRQIDQMIIQKENELKNVDQEIQKLINNPSVATANDPKLQEYLKLSDQIRLENLNMQKQSLMNQINVLNQRKQEVSKQKEEEERNIQQMQEKIKNNYQISLDQLNALKKQLESYQSSMNVNYQKQIEALNSQVQKLQKEIEDLLNQQPSTPEEAEQIAQKVAEKRNLINTLKGQIDLASQEINNINAQINQQIQQLEQQMGDIKRQMQVDFYNKWAMDQAIRREVEQIIWTEMMNEKNHIANLWKMYFDTNQKIAAIWKDMYFKKIADQNDFVARWTKALGA